MEKNGGGKDLDARMRAAVARECEEAPHRPPDHKIRVLVAEDHTIVREAIAARLAREPDIEIVKLAASSGEMAVEIARRVQPDVIVMDVIMGGMDGIEATRRIKSDLPQTAVIGLSVDPKPETVNAMLQAGASAYLTKFASLEELLQAIREHAAKPQTVPRERDE